jgi:hypothetical protein
MADSGDFVEVPNPHGGPPLRFPSTMSRAEIADVLNSNPPPAPPLKDYELKDVPGKAVESLAQTWISDPLDYAQRLIEKPGETLDKTKDALLATGQAVGQQAATFATPAGALGNALALPAHYIAPETTAAVAAAVKKATGLDITLSQQMVDDLIKSYGGWEEIKRSLAEHPTRTALDLVSVLIPAAKAATTTTRAIPSVVRRGAQVVGVGEKAADRVGRVLTDAERAHLTPDQLTKLQGTVEQGLPGWTGEAADTNIRKAYNQLLFDEAGITPTPGMLDGSEASRKAEDRMRGGGDGTGAQQIMVNADKDRAEALAKAQSDTRAGISGSADKLSPDTVGERLGKAVRDAEKLADDNVNTLYDKAFDPAEQANRGIPLAVDTKLVKDLPTQVKGAMVDGNQVFAITKESTPKSWQAQQLLNDWAKDGKLPVDIFPGEVPPPTGVDGVSWQSVKQMRSYLNSLRRQAIAAARTSNDWSDVGGMNRVMKTLDEQFGRSNSLLNEASGAHAEMMRKFYPGTKTSAAGVPDAMRKLLNPNNTGATNFNTLFSEGKLSQGAQKGVTDHLMTILGSDPEAMKAMKEGVLHNLFFNPDNVPKTPQMTSTALQKALEGRRSGVYSSLLSDDDINALSRHKALTDNVAESTKIRNPPRTSYPLLNFLGRGASALTGAAVGAASAHKLGIPPGVLEIGGGVAGDRLRNFLAAQRAIRATTPEAERGMSLPLKGALSYGAARPYSEPVEPGALSRP